MSNKNQLIKTLSTHHVVIAGIALVVAASTLVSDFTGFINIGIGFVLALILAFFVNLLLGISVGKLASKYPRAGTIYNYTKSVVGGQKGAFLGLVLGLTFYLMSSFAISGETLAGAFALKILLGWDIDESFFVIGLFIIGLLPNLFNIKTTSWIAGILLILMMGIRWAFGIIGFMGLNDIGSWDWENFASSEITILGTNGFINEGLALAVWSFIGIEFCCSLAEEVKAPSKTLPKGIFYSLIIILLTSLSMGIGVSGVLPQNEWKSLILSELGCYGECPQLAIGQTMLGRSGFLLMAFGSVLATLSSLIVMLAAMPRLLYGMVQDEANPNSLSKWIGQINPDTGTPLNAILLTFTIYIIPSFWGDKIMTWIFSAAYIWLLIYGVYHILSSIDIVKRKDSQYGLYLPIVGLISTIISLYYAFEGSHEYFGLRALLMIGVAVFAALVIKFR